MPYFNQRRMKQSYIDGAFFTSEKRHGKRYHMHQVLSSRGCKKITNDYVCLFHSAAPKILLRSFIYVYPPPDILRTYKHDVMVKLVAYVCLQVIYIYK